MTELHKLKCMNFNLNNLNMHHNIHIQSWIFICWLLIDWYNCATVVTYWNNMAGIEFENVNIILFK